MHALNCHFYHIITMDPHTKKVVLMTSISFGIIMFAYFIPIYVVPVVLDVSSASNCIDSSCASSTFNKCGGYTTENSDGDSFAFWKKGMHGMLCMIGIEKGASANVYQMSPRSLIVIPSN